MGEWARKADGRRTSSAEFSDVWHDGGSAVDAAWLQEHGVTHVAMESTGVYWRAVFYLLEDAFTCLLVNPAHVKHVPGRKTDDSAWIAQLLEHGLLRGSFVPPAPIRELRDLTRLRKAATQAEPGRRGEVTSRPSTRAPPPRVPPPPALQAPPPHAGSPPEPQARPISLSLPLILKRPVTGYANTRCWASTTAGGCSPPSAATKACHEVLERGYEGLVTKDPVSP